MRLEDIELVLHVPVYIGEALLGCVVVGVLSLLISKGRYHAIVELLDLRCRVLATLVSWWTLRPHLSHSHVLRVFVLRRG